jgi:ribosomal protein S18 acetylase RimI-like enzyme
MNSLSIEIRPVTPPDVPAISSLAREIWQATYPGIITQEQIDFMLELYLHPDVQRQGVGGQLIEHVAARAKKMGYPCMILAVNKRNEKAIGSYKKYGFVVREAIVDDIGRGFVMDDFVMEKKL